MKRRILGCVQTLILGCCLFASCSKGKEMSALDEQRARLGNEGKGAGLVGPAPIPLDTLELDTLNRIGFQ